MPISGTGSGKYTNRWYYNVLLAVLFVMDIVIGLLALMKVLMG